VTIAESKLESQSSTLPRAGHSGKSLPLTTAANIPSSGLTGTQTQAVATGETPSIAAGKRRSVVHLHQMQTESSLAKVNAGKDSSSESFSMRGGLSKKESYTMLRFPSTPEIAAGSSAESTKNSHRPRSVENTDESPRLPTDGRLKADSGSRLKTPADDTSRSMDGNDRTLMPPPLSTAVPLSYQATFIAKAAKHRRTTMPESLARSFVKHQRLSESSSATDSDESPPFSSSVSTVKRKSNVSDSTSLDPAQLDVHKMQNRVQLADALSHNVPRADQHSDSVSSADSSVTGGSPVTTKVGDHVSPVRPQSASSSNFRRQLPADPLSITRVSAEFTTALDSVTQLPLLRSASAEAGMRSIESTPNNAAAMPQSAGRLSTEASANTPAQAQQSPVSRQDNGQRLIASKTETRLVLNTGSAENLAQYTPQQTIINQIERYCTERRMSVDAEQHRSSPVPPGGRTRQQWEKANTTTPLIMKCQSNSSVSQTASSSSVCDSSVLADVSSSSRNSSTPEVPASVLDSAVSYGSAAATFQMPAKVTMSAAAVSVTADSLKHSSKAAEAAAIEYEHMSELKAAHPVSSGLPLSAMSSDK